MCDINLNMKKLVESQKTQFFQEMTAQYMYGLALKMKLKHEPVKRISKLTGLVRLSK